MFSFFGTILVKEILPTRKNNVEAYYTERVGALLCSPVGIRFDKVRLCMNMVPGTRGPAQGCGSILLS